MKTFLIYVVLAIVNFIINFIIYNYSFNLQATPYLHEDQRLDSGLLMLKITLPAYIVATIIITFMFYFVSKARKPED